MFVRRMLRATGVGVRHPDRRQAEQVGEFLVRQGAAEVWQERRLLAGRLPQRARRPARPGAVRVEPRRGKVRLAAGADLHLDEALPIEMTAQRRHDVVGIGADHVTQLTARPGAWLDGVHGPVRLAANEGQHAKGVPAEDLFRGAQARFAPVRIDPRPLRRRHDSAVRERLAHRRRQAVGAPFGDPDDALVVGDRRQCMGEYQARIGEQPAPIPRMVAPFAQIDFKVDGRAAARAHEQRRAILHQARPVGGDQHVRRQAVPFRDKKLMQTGRAGLLAHLDDDFHIEAERPARLQHRAERRHIDQVLPLVVGGAAAIDLVALLDDRPGRQALAPTVFQAADDIAMAIGQHRRQVVALVALTDQEGAVPRHRIG